MPFRVEALMPNLALIALAERIRIFVAATPVDESSSWLFFRYDSTYGPWSWLQTATAWIAVQSELRRVQPQDWRIFESVPGGTLDDVPMRRVRANKPIASIVAGAQSCSNRSSPW